MNVDTQVKRIDLVDGIAILDAIVSINVGGVDLLGLPLVDGVLPELMFWQPDYGCQVVFGETVGPIDRVAATAYDEAKKRNDPPISIEVHQSTDDDPTPLGTDFGELVARTDGAIGGKEFQGMCLVESGPNNAYLSWPAEEFPLDLSVEEIAHVEVAIRYACMARLARQPMGRLRLVWSRPD